MDGSEMKTKLILILIMALLAKGKEIEADDSPGLCDQSFIRVDTRTPAHLLPPGVAADALNMRSEDGRFWPRFATDLQPWGLTGIGLVPAGAQYNIVPGQQVTGYLVNLTPGERYYYVKGNSQALYNGPNAPGPVIPPGLFTATAAKCFLAGAGGTEITAQIFRVGNVCGYTRFKDPEGNDCQVLVTDDWRDQQGEDGGRGRAWLIQANNGPLAVPMNGNDIYGTARLIPCDQGLVLLRQDLERHYFPAAAVGGGLGADTIQLNCQPAWENGDEVYFVADGTVGSALTGGTGPQSGGYCFVKNIGNNQIKLYQDSGLANAYTFTGALGRFYIERQALQPGFGGNGAPPLICQPGPEGETMWDAGFEEMPAQYFVSSVNGDLVTTAIPHRLIPGDTCYYNHSGTNSAQLFACPTSATTVIFYTTEFDALGNTGNNTSSPTFAAGDYVVKTTAANQPMPPCREGFYTQQGCLVGVNGLNTLMISQPKDPLHYMPLTDVITAALGDNDAIVAVNEIPNVDALIIYKATSIMALYNFTAGLSNSGQSWTLAPVTREYGLLAALSLGQAGANNFFVSRRGVDRVSVNALGTLLPSLRPVSYNQLKYINQVDWSNAGLACAGTWNNRYVIALPKAGQAAGAAGVMTNATVGGPQNNLAMSLNLLNSDEAKDEWGWEGLWNGFTVYGFARLTLAGEGERMTFCDYNGNVNWFSDGWQDLGTSQIPQMLLTRRYTGGTQNRKIFQTALVIMDTYDTDITANAIAPGVNRIYPLIAPEYDAVDYLQGPNVPGGYNPNTQQPAFNTPFREDYTPQVLAETVGNAVEQHQNINQPYRMRVDAWGIQVQLQNSRGSMRVASVMVGGVMGPSPQRLHA